MQCPSTVYVCSTEGKMVTFMGLEVCQSNKAGIPILSASEWCSVGLFPFILKGIGCSLFSHYSGIRSCHSRLGFKPNGFVSGLYSNWHFFIVSGESVNALLKSGLVYSN